MCHTLGDATRHAVQYHGLEMTEQPNLQVTDLLVVIITHTMVLPRGLPPLVLLATTGTLILAYILAVYTRQPIPDWKREQDRELGREVVLIPAGTFGFPSWYGRGGSPYDFGVEDTGRELRVVFVLGGLGLGVLTVDLARESLRGGGVEPGGLTDGR